MEGVSKVDVRSQTEGAEVVTVELHPLTLPCGPSRMHQAPQGEMLVTCLHLFIMTKFVAAAQLESIDTLHHCL